MKQNSSKKPKKAASARAATARSTKPRTAPLPAKGRKSITAKVACEVFHDLVHEISEDDHIEGKTDPITGVSMPGFFLGGAITDSERLWAITSSSGLTNGSA